MPGGCPGSRASRWDAAEGTGLIVHLRRDREVPGKFLWAWLRHQGHPPPSLGRMPGRFSIMAS